MMTINIDADINKEKAGQVLETFYTHVDTELDESWRGLVLVDARLWRGMLDVLDEFCQDTPFVEMTEDHTLQRVTLRWPSFEVLVLDRLTRRKMDAIRRGMYRGFPFVGFVLYDNFRDYDTILNAKLYNSRHECQSVSPTILCKQLCDA